MKAYTKRVVAAALTTVALAAPLTVGATAASATSFSPAINTVPCDHLSEYVVVTYHYSGEGDTAICFANAGDYQLTTALGHLWVTRISTGNNRVQWYGDGKWQPNTPIGKNTVFTWPHYPAGVDISSIRIL